MPSGIIEPDFPARTLFLLRHATAEQDAPRDHQRPLSVHGLAEAEALGAVWKNLLHWPEIIRCSDALRTQQTCKHLCQGAGEAIPDTWEPVLYDANPGDVLEIIQALPAETRSALIIGHNPTIHQTAAMLSQPETLYGPAGKSLMRGYAPCTLTVMHVPSERTWAQIAPATLILHSIHRSQDGWI